MTKQFSSRNAYIAAPEPIFFSKTSHPIQVWRRLFCFVCLFVCLFVCCCCCFQFIVYIENICNDMFQMWKWRKKPKNEVKYDLRTTLSTILMFWWASASKLYKSEHSTLSSCTTWRCWCLGLLFLTCALLPNLLTIHLKNIRMCLKFGLKLTARLTKRSLYCRCKLIFGLKAKIIVYHKLFFTMLHQ